MLNYLKDRYHNIPMFISENGTRLLDSIKDRVMIHMYMECTFDQCKLVFIGFGDLQKPETTVKELLNDTKRIQYMNGYLDALQSAMR